MKENWIPVYPWVKKGETYYNLASLPEEGETVIISCITTDPLGVLRAYVMTGWWLMDEEEKRPVWICDQGHEPEIVFAWMPLPDFPSWYTDAEEGYE